MIFFLILNDLLFDIAWFLFDIYIFDYQNYVEQLLVYVLFLFVCSFDMCYHVISVILILNNC